MKKAIFSYIVCFIIVSCNSNKTIDDYRFENNSLITIKEYTNQDITNLFILCKTWGFMRYYHPKIVQGEQNWDYELFRVMPSILEAKSAKQRNRILNHWLKKQEKVKPETTILLKGTERSVPDFRWLEEANLGRAAKRLIEIKTGKKDFYPTQDSILLVEKILKKDEIYAELSALPDVGFRLLVLFRYWNIIEYFSPHKDIIGQNWDKILLAAIPKFIEVDNENDYRLLLLELVASINDGHAKIHGAIIDRQLGRNQIPVRISFIEEKAVVIEKYGIDSPFETDKSLNIGDIIIAVNDIPIDSIIMRQTPYTSASNYPAKLREIARNLLRTKDSRLKITYDRNNIVQSDSFATYNQLSLFSLSNPSLYSQLTKDHAYIYMGGRKDDQTPKDIDAKGIIIDLRCYPNEESVKYMDSLPLYSNSVSCAIFAVPVLPGVFIFRDNIPTTKIGSENLNYFKGKKVILVDIETQSWAEFMAMSYRCAPNSIIIGSPSAGANGDILPIILPGAIRTMITGLGVYFPNGRGVQRTGIIPDIEVKQTIKGVRNGRDELIEEAIKIING